MMGSVGSQVWDLIQQWNPSQVHDHENKYQSELQNYLDQALNESGGGMGMGLDMGGGSHAVSTERGTSYGDVVVDDTVGIELKRNFSNSQKRKLRGQLEDYADNYDWVIACTCGVEDTDGWHEVEGKFGPGQRGMMETTEFRFIIKRRENFGSEDGGSSSNTTSQSGPMDDVVNPADDVYDPSDDVL
jgi:hypothetical protein